MCSQNASGCSISGSLIHFIFGTEFLGSKIAPPPLKFAALFGRTPRTCLRPALAKDNLKIKVAIYMNRGVREGEFNVIITFYLKLDEFYNYHAKNKGQNRDDCYM